jgi:hypothetical protein
MSEQREKVTIIGLGIEVESKSVFSLGRIGLSLSLMCFGFMLLSGSISKEEDLKAYYNFWQHYAPRRYGGQDAEDELRAFSQSSFFEFQRFVNIMGLILGSGLMLADNRYGCLYSMLSVGYYALTHMNPLIESDSHTWLMLIQAIAVIGGLIIAYTRGHLRGKYAEASTGAQFKRG